MQVSTEHSGLLSSYLPLLLLPLPLLAHLVRVPCCEQGTDCIPVELSLFWIIRKHPDLESQAPLVWMVNKVYCCHQSRCCLDAHGHSELITLFFVPNPQRQGCSGAATSFVSWLCFLVLGNGP
ncbi:hypothetical protein B0O80DRAFT_440967 [Mortierella sp. GBAus27b]|nr:hypothetical protein B0O80DRAFT_440967 [Mortierella sp. GBAus27b]